jgi:hypothetical protein
VAQPDSAVPGHGWAWAGRAGRGGGASAAPRLCFFFCRPASERGDEREREALPGPALDLPIRPAPSLTHKTPFFPHTPNTGAIDFISRHYDLARVAFRGASAGGLVVTLAACGVPAERALTAAHSLAVANDLFDRPMGAAGIFGSVVRDWLHDLLPDDAVDRCGRGRLKLVVTPVRPLTLFAPATVDCFRTKDELVDACMASAHVPFFLDGRPVASYRGRAYMDGSFQDFFTRGNSDALACGGGAYVLDYLHDDALELSGRLDFLKLRDLEGARELMAAGAAYARRQMEAGALDRHFSGVRLAGSGGDGPDGLAGLAAPAVAGL